LSWLVPRIQPSTSAGASDWMDGRDKPDHDNAAVPSQDGGTRSGWDAALDPRQLIVSAVQLL